MDVVHTSAIFLMVSFHNITLVGEKTTLPVKSRVVLVVSILLNLIMTTKLPYHTPNLIERGINLKKKQVCDKKVNKLFSNYLYLLYLMCICCTMCVLLLLL